MIDFALKFADICLNPLVPPILAHYSLGGGWSFVSEVSSETRYSLSYSGIYCWWIVGTDYLYVGQSKNIWKRWNEHLGDSSKGYGKLTRFSVDGRQAIFNVLQFEKDYWQRLSLEKEWKAALVSSRDRQVRDSRR